MSKKQLTTTVDDDVIEEAKKVFSDLGISMSTGVNIYLRRVAAEKRIPFSVGVYGADGRPDGE